MTSTASSFADTLRGAKKLHWQCAPNSSRPALSGGIAMVSLQSTGALLLEIGRVVAETTIVVDGFDEALILGLRRQMLSASG